MNTEERICEMMARINEIKNAVNVLDWRMRQIESFVQNCPIETHGKQLESFGREVRCLKKQVAQLDRDLDMHLEES